VQAKVATYIEHVLGAVDVGLRLRAPSFTVRPGCLSYGFIRCVYYFHVQTVTVWSVSNIAHQRGGLASKTLSLGGVWLLRWDKSNATTKESIFPTYTAQPMSALRCSTVPVMLHCAFLGHPHQPLVLFVSSSSFRHLPCVP